MCLWSELSSQARERRPKQKGRGCPRPFWEYSVARPFQPRLVSPRPPLGSYAEILSIVVVICDIHKLSDELHPEGDQRAYLTQHLNDPYSPTSILIRPHRTSPELHKEVWPDGPRTMPRSSRGLLVEAGGIAAPVRQVLNDRSLERPESRSATLSLR